MVLWCASTPLSGATADVDALPQAALVCKTVRATQDIPDRPMGALHASRASLRMPQDPRRAACVRQV